MKIKLHELEKLTGSDPLSLLAVGSSLIDSLIWARPQQMEEDHLLLEYCAEGKLGGIHLG